MTKVVNIKSGEYYDVTIMRGTIWGNPFRIPRDGSREEVIRKYENYVRNNEFLMSRIVNDLGGKILGCVCKPEACHGDVLLKILSEKVEQDRRLKNEPI